MRASTLIISGLILLTPFFFVLAQGGLVPCNGPECQACHVVKLAQNIINFLITVSVFIAVLLFAWAGMIMVTAGGSTEAISKARGMFTSVAIGFIIVLAAWLIVDTIMRLLTKQDPNWPWNEIKCASLAAVPGGSTQPGGVGTGQCSPVASGACSAGSLSGAFGGAATQASSICNAESAGNPAALSGTDKLRSSGDSFSVGLFQINLTVHELQGCGPGGSSLKCNQAFSGRNYDATIVNRDLYNQCVTAAQNADCNIANAQRIYQTAGSSWSPWGANSKCGF